MRLIYSRKNYQDSSLKSQDTQFYVNLRPKQKSSGGQCNFKWGFYSCVKYGRLNLGALYNEERKRIVRPSHVSQVEF